MQHPSIVGIVRHFIFFTTSLSSLHSFPSCPVSELTSLRIFNALTTFSASSNYLRALNCSIRIHSLKSLTLDYNEFSTLSDIIVLRECSSLEVLRLKGNNITSIDREPYVLAPFHRFGGKSCSQSSPYTSEIQKAD